MQHWTLGGMSRIWERWWDWLPLCQLSLSHWKLRAGRCSWSCWKELSPSALLAAPAELRPSMDEGPGTVNCGQGGDRRSSCPKSLKRLKGLPLPAWMSQLIFSELHKWALSYIWYEERDDTKRSNSLIPPLPKKLCAVCLLNSGRTSLLGANYFRLWWVLHPLEAFRSWLHIFWKREVYAKQVVAGCRNSWRNHLSQEV